MQRDKAAITYLTGLFFPVFVGVAFSNADFVKELKRLKIEDPVDFDASPASMKAYGNNGQLTLIVCFNPFRDKRVTKNQKIALIAHECVHVSDAIFRHVGETTPGDETRAYLVQHILQEILYLLDEYLKGKKRGKKRKNQRQ